MSYADDIADRVAEREAYWRDYFQGMIDTPLPEGIPTGEDARGRSLAELTVPGVAAAADAFRKTNVAE